LLRNSCGKIGPVAYDVTGRNDFYGYGRINALKAVTGAKLLPKLQVVILGAVSFPLTYPSSSPSPLPVSGVVVKLSGDDSKQTQTASDGPYQFITDAGGTFRVTPSLTQSASPASGLSTIDISLVRRHILGLTLLDTPFKLLAADVNGSRSISIVDVSSM